MTVTLEGADVSLWVASTTQTNYPTLATDDTVYDVVVVGGGITGVVAAYELQQRRLRVALIEKSRIVEWTTGGTTAKLSSQHYLIYDYLIQRQGEQTVRAFAQANESGIARVEELSQLYDIDCEFARRDSYVFSRQHDKLPQLHSEVAAAQQLGLPATFETEIDLPFTISGAVSFSHQAQFHPRKFLLGLAEHFLAHGGVIYEHTKALDIIPGEPHVIPTNHGDLKAKTVLQASGEPFWKNELFRDFMWLKMSYALAVSLRDPAAYPKSMYITTDTPMRTIRTASFEGKPVMIFGGESHEYDEATYNEELHYANLIEDVHSRFDVEKVHFRWLAGDYMPYDRMPYIGALPDYPSIYVVTGYRAWGLAWAMSAASAIAQDVAGSPEEWVRPFNLDRLAHPLPKAERVHGF